MYPFLRAGRVLSRAIKTHRSPGIRASEITMRIWPNDLDTNAHLNNGRYLTLMDLGRFDLMTQCGLVRIVTKNRWFPVAGGVMVRFERPLHLFEKIMLRSQIIGWDEKWLFFSHDLFSGAHRAARATTRGLFRSRGQSISSQQLLDAMNYDGASMILPEYVQQWMEIDRLMTQNQSEPVDNQ